MEISSSQSFGSDASSICGRPYLASASANATAKFEDASALGS